MRQLAFRLLVFVYCALMGVAVELAVYGPFLR
jgi:hypothetical protein